MGVLLYIWLKSRNYYNLWGYNFKILRNIVLVKVKKKEGSNKKKKEKVKKNIKGVVNLILIWY